MNLNKIVRKSVLTQPQYQAGKPIEYVAREFGLNPSQILKMASNENPLGPSPKAINAIANALPSLNYYPDGGCYELSNKIAKHLGLKPTQLVFGNGSNEVLELVAHTFIGENENAVTGNYSFIVYKLATLLMGGKIKEIDMPNLHYDLNLIREAIDEKTKVVFITNPNNPTGAVISHNEMIAFAKSLPEHVVLCYDEAYMEYQDSPVDLRSLIAEGRKIICCRTFSKIYGLAGLRVGYGYASEELAGYINRVREPFNVNSLAQIGALAALDDTDFVSESKKINTEGMKQISDKFKELNIQHIAEGGNFIMFKINNALKIFDSLQKVGVIIRPNVGYGLPDWLRVTIGKKNENDRFLTELIKLI